MNIQVESLVLMDASVYAEGTGNLATLPKATAYAGVSSHQMMYIKVYWKLCNNPLNFVVLGNYEIGIRFIY